MNQYLKKLSVIILLIILIIIILNYYSDESNDFSDRSKEIISNSRPGVTEILNPTFKNRGLDSNPYEINAKKGLQIGQDIELLEVFGKFSNDDNELFYINSDKALFSQIDQTIDLVGNVLIYDDFGNNTSTNNATIDLDNKKIFLLSEVISKSNNSLIQSNKSTVDKKNNTITYTGNVKVKIDNK